VGDEWQGKLSSILREHILATYALVEEDDDSVLRVREAGPHVGQLDRRHKRVLEEKARASGARKFAKSEQHSRFIILKIKIFKFVVSWKYEKYSQLNTKWTYLDCLEAEPDGDGESDEQEETGEDGEHNFEELWWSGRRWALNSVTCGRTFWSWSWHRRFSNINQ